tara:strand:- start:1322 stop:1588 length:267 start_codon:yes stop_codon:yes gene_type:complete
MSDRKLRFYQVTAEDGELGDYAKERFEPLWQLACQHPKSYFHQDILGQTDSVRCTVCDFVSPRYYLVGTVLRINLDINEVFPTESDDE